MRPFVRAFLKDESGATAIEYGLIAAGIAVVVIATGAGHRHQLEDDFRKRADGVEIGEAERLERDCPGLGRSGFMPKLF
jgi:pilus assembly protein Flp/PilA